MKKNTELVRIGIWSVIAILAIVLFVLFTLKQTATGQFTSTGVYNQYEPKEACEIQGCVWDLALQQGMYINPFTTPSAGCYCNGVVTYVPLIVPLY